MADLDAVGNNNEWVNRERKSEDICDAMRRINALEKLTGIIVPDEEEIDDPDAYGFGRGTGFSIFSNKEFQPYSLAVKDQSGGLVVSYNPYQFAGYPVSTPAYPKYYTMGVSHFSATGKLLDDFTESIYNAVSSSNDNRICLSLKNVGNYAFSYLFPANRYSYSAASPYSNMRNLKQKIQNISDISYSSETEAYSFYLTANNFDSTAAPRLTGPGGISYVGSFVYKVTMYSAGKVISHIAPNGLTHNGHIVCCLEQMKVFNDGTAFVLGLYDYVTPCGVFLNADYSVRCIYRLNRLSGSEEHLDWLKVVYSCSVAHDRNTGDAFVALGGYRGEPFITVNGVLKFEPRKPYVVLYRYHIASSMPMIEAPSNRSVIDTSEAFPPGVDSNIGEIHTAIACDMKHKKLLVSFESGAYVSEQFTTFGGKLKLFNYNTLVTTQKYVYLRCDNKTTYPYNNAMAPQQVPLYATTNYENFRYLIPSLSSAIFPEHAGLWEGKIDYVPVTPYTSFYYSIACDEEGYLYMLCKMRGVILRYKLYIDPDDTPSLTTFYTGMTALGSAIANYRIGEATAVWTHWGDLLPPDSAYDPDNLPENILPDYADPDEQEPSVEQTVSLDYDQTEWYVYNSNGTKTSMGTPNGGVSTPDLGRLSYQIPQTLRSPTEEGILNDHAYIRDMRNALERLARNGLYEDAQGVKYNWIPGSPNHLLYAAMKDKWRFYGRATAGYDWTNSVGRLANAPSEDVDIGEIYECIRLLEDASASLIEVSE